MTTSPSGSKSSGRLEYDVAALASMFEIPGAVVQAEAYGSGHINDTYRVVFQHDGIHASYVLQRINHHVFRNPVALMENVRRVTAHLGRRCSHRSQLSRRVLTLIPTRAGESHHRDAGGNYWRAYHFIGRARTLNAVETAAQAYEAARAFGEFQKLLADLPAPRLNDTIPDFHDTPKRFAAFEQAVSADAADRVRRARPEIDFARRHQRLCHALMSARLPERVTHNDAKLNNVMLDETTGEGICVIDLDTVMPGLALYDFGDMVRTTTSPANEDERELSRVRMQFPMFEALARGYLASAGEFLTPAERSLLPVAGKVITFEIGLRFLTDYLAGDVYFKVQREGHNLDRCRTQFKLLESIGGQEAQMNQLIESL